MARTPAKRSVTAPGVANMLRLKVVGRYQGPENGGGPITGGAATETIERNYLFVQSVKEDGSVITTNLGGGGMLNLPPGTFAIPMESFPSETDFPNGSNYEFGGASV